MFTKYFKFYLYSMLAVVGALVATVCFNMFGSSTLAKSLAIVSMTLGGVILFEALVIYLKIMKILCKVVDNITLSQVIASVVSSVVMFVAVCFLGHSNNVFFVLLPLGIIIRLVFKVHQVNRILPFLCSDLDEEIKSFNEESESDCECGDGCDCGEDCSCGGDHSDSCGCGDDCKCGK
ncbi:MAG: hypothetical protein R3Y65_08995 [Bacillota bacterium]